MLLIFDKAGMAIIRKIRRLDRDEMTLHLMQTHFDGYGNLIRVIALSGDFCLARLKRTLVGMMRLYPQLMASIAGERKPYFTIEDEFLPPSIHIYPRTSDQSIHNAIDAELNQSLLPEKLLWRVSVVQAPSSNDWELILYLHHAIADGFSSYQFVHQFLLAYSKNSVDSSQSGVMQDFPQSAQDYYLPKHKGVSHWVNCARWIIDVFKEVAVNRAEPRPWLDHNQKHQTQSTKINFSQATFHALKRLARQEDIALHAVFTAAVMIAGKVLCKGEAVAVLSSTNTRSRLAAGATTGLAARYGSFMQSRKINEQTHFWTLAKSLSSHSQSFLAKGHDITASRFSLPAMKAHCKNPKAMPYHFQLANIGEIPLQTRYHHLYVREVIGGQNFNGANNILGINLLTFNQQVTLNLCYVKAQFSEAEITLFIDRLNNLLMALIAESTQSAQSM